MTNTIFAEHDGRIIIEMEAAPIAEPFTEEGSYCGIWNEWVAETEHVGFTGSCYYRWDGPELKVNPGSGILSYRFHIDEPGVYLLSIRNISIGPGNANAAFVRVDGGQWHKVKSKIHNEWTWNLTYEHFRDEENPSRQPCWHHFDHGEHLLEVSGRCNGFILDRIAITRQGVEGHDPALPQSRTI